MAELFCLVPQTVDGEMLLVAAACFEEAVTLQAEEALFAGLLFPAEIVPADLTWLPSAEEARTETVVPFGAAAADDEGCREAEANTLPQLIAAVMMRLIILRCMLILSLKKSVFVFSYGR